MSAWPPNGARKHPKEYTSWRNMRNRCLNSKAKDYHNYGARGIRVLWRSFADFFGDLGECPDGYSLDRIDNNGDYFAENCRWATKREQDNNRRTNVFFTHDGRTLTITQWARELNVSSELLHHRLDSNPSISGEDLFKPTGYVKLGRPSRVARYSLDGQFVSLRAMSEYLAIRQATLWVRLNSWR